MLKADDSIEFNEMYNPITISECDFRKVECELSISLPSDYKWFLSKLNGLDVDGMIVNGIVEYNFEPDEKSYDIIEETKLLRKQINYQNSPIDISDFLALNIEDSAYLVLYDVNQGVVKIFIFVPEFRQIAMSQNFLEYILSILDDYLNE